MSLTISCPSCKANYSVHEDLIGKQICCKGCQRVFKATDRREKGGRSSDVEVEEKPRARRNPDVVIDEDRNPDVVIDDQPQPRRRRDRDEEDEGKLSSGNVVYIVVVAVVGVVLLLGVFLLVFLPPGTGGTQVAQNGPQNNSPPGGNPVPQQPVSQVATDAKLLGAWGKVFLTDMQELDVVKGPWPLGKHGQTGAPATPGTDTSVRVNGIPSPNGLGLHPPANGFASVRYALGRRAQEVRGGVAFNDADNLPPPAPTTFVIKGDGKELWRSATMNARKVRQDFRVNVSAVEMLELRVECNVFSIHAHAVWVEPYVVADASTPVQ
jgi:hypothetical protein